MKHTASISLGCVAALAMIAGCPTAAEDADGGETSTNGGQTTGSAEDTDGPETGAADETTAPGSDDSDGSGSEGEGSTGADVPPTVDCGAGETLVGSVEIEDDADIAQLDGIAIVTGDVIVAQTSFTTLDFLSCLEEIHGNIQIFDNGALLDITGTNNLTTVGRLPANTPTPTNPDLWDMGTGSIAISGNDALLDIDGFTALVQIGREPERGVDGCPGAPPGLECVSRQSLVIRNNGSATAVSGFTELELVYGSLNIQQNDSLLNIDGFESLIGVGGAFAVANNPSLCMSSVNAVGAGLEFLGDMGSSTTVGNDDGC